MNRNYFRILSATFFFSLCLQFFAAPGVSRANHLFFDSEDSVYAFQGINAFHKDSSGKVKFTQSKEVNISMEQKTSGDATEKEGGDAVAGDELDEEGLDDSFEDLEDPFAEETPEYPAINDPYEGYNRFMFNVNDKAYTYVLKPIATGYTKVVPEPVRLAIKNLFLNVRSPVNFVSSVVQGDMDKTGRVLSRLIINTTVGLGGLFDVASKFDIEPVDEDFDQALGHHGVPTGPYIVLPLLGPSSGRNAMGTVVDTLLNPTTFVSPSFAVGTGITFTNITNETSFNLDAYDDLKESAVDPYISLRDFNHQYREGLVRK
ncbi:MAG: VacJ family lipoprotein [Nitrospinales bacterium]